MARVGRYRPASVRRYRWVWRRVRVALFAVLTLSIGVRLLETRVNPGWAGWTTVRYATGAAFVVGLLAYGAVVLWRRRDHASGRR